MQQTAFQIVDAISLVRAETVLCLAASLFFLLAVFTSFSAKTWGWVSLGVLLLAALLLPTSVLASPPSLAGVFRADLFSQIARWFAFGVGALFLALSLGKVADSIAAEFYACVLLVIAGLGLTAAANDLILLFLALEFVSIPTYILLYLQRADNSAQEATTKYFFLSVFSAAMFLYGLSLLYGATGTTNLEAIRAATAAAAANPDGPGMPAVLLVALVMLTAGLCFRLTAAPFHFYAPDVYEGAPTLAVTLLAVVPKIAGAIGLYQLVAATLLTPGAGSLFTTLAGPAAGLFWIMALVSMVIGNLVGLWQDDIKRLFAYSGVAHAGYLLVGLGAATQAEATADGLAAVGFYLAIYTLMTLGSFAVLVCLETPGRPLRTIDDLAGLSRSHPLLAFLMAVCLFSLTGLPPTAGFLAKLNLFFAAWSTGQPLYQLLALLMALCAAAGAWYYLRIVGVMYLRDAVKPLTPRANVPAVGVAAVCGLLLLWLFLFPRGAYRWAEEAMKPSPVLSAKPR